MALTNLKVIKDEQATQPRAPEPIASYNARSDEGAGPRPIPVRKGLHLDVDAVLARSLPRLTAEAPESGRENNLPLI